VVPEGGSACGGLSAVVSVALEQAPRLIATWLPIAQSATGPAFALGAGALVDGRGARTVMIWADLARAVVSGAVVVADILAAMPLTDMGAWVTSGVAPSARGLDGPGLRLRCARIQPASRAAIQASTPWSRQLPLGGRGRRGRERRRSSPWRRRLNGIARCGLGRRGVAGASAPARHRAAKDH
jgi:hypothetical protein